MPKVSIIVPIYNVSKYLERSIISIQNQTLKDIEIILINDGSTDNSLDICKRYTKYDDRIRLIDKPNGGVSSARNIGLEIATGDYIGFVDPDDWIDKNMYLKMYKQITKYDADICLCDHYEVNITGKNIQRNEINRVVLEKQQIINEIILPMLSPRYTKPYEYIKISRPMWSGLYKATLLRDNKVKFDKGLIKAQDVLFNLNAHIVANKVTYLNKPLYYYLKRDESTTNKYHKNINHIGKIYQNRIKKFYFDNELDKFGNRFDTILFNARLVKIINEFKNPNTSLINKLKFCRASFKKIEPIVDKLDVKNAKFKHKILFSVIKLRLYFVLYLYYKFKDNL
ncbi:hypothetical protein AN639_02280 [Candidatus Epulonipiscium fishelsonii]|uniref:Uncharacterized protein n=1 Tax=Candidatus Epulonipiscium fishelsonii TaxID=77094 RepID=A0ACC8XH01_9FIRM|nr:hypothetical protein AN639_02280 [Epulopiscium sp. SCG-B05WGA-EpuloA1]ONI43000.1 hypothetical protein AN396_00115 [Epulopiscium sp. SCG-B11WGA-EpuloA1]